MQIDLTVLETAAAFVRDRWPEARPTAGLVLGSGWSEVVDAFDIEDAIGYESIPGLGRPGVVGHAGRLVLASSAGVSTLIFQGRRHWYEGEGWTPVALPIYVLKSFGVGTVLLTNAAGGIRDGFKPGDLMILRDHINFLGANPLIGPHQKVWGARFPDQTALYDPALREALARAAAAVGEPICEGVYLAGSGPTYETPAEIQMFRTLGADAVGMSTVPEAQLAGASGMRVAGLSCITNLAAGISPNKLSHEEVTDTTKASMARMKSVVLAFWKELGRG